MYCKPKQNTDLSCNHVFVTVVFHHQRQIRCDRIPSSAGLPFWILFPFSILGFFSLWHLLFGCELHGPETWVAQGIAYNHWLRYLATLELKIYFKSLTPDQLFEAEREKKGEKEILQRERERNYKAPSVAWIFQSISSTTWNKPRIHLAELFDPGSP